MNKLLLDKGVYTQVAQAFRILGLDAVAVGEPESGLADNEPDEVNVKWCKENNAVLVTNDRGKKDKAIRNALVQEHVHAIFILSDLRTSGAHALARALLRCEENLEAQTARRSGLVAHRLTPNGGLKRPGKW